ncbi:MAG TPA: hypothetical protein VM843_02765 [Flavisolibacter sp.]|nr:hypothetical protein [Flavisolibacter sp.]
MNLASAPKHFFALSIFLLSSFLSTSQVALKGKLVHGFSADVKEYTFGTKTHKTLFQKGTDPFVAHNGDIYFVDDAFLKRNALIRKYTPALQFKDVLDMSSDNPEYKKALEEYSVIRNTGISGILSRMSDPKVSPDGKLISVTIFGYAGQAFTKNCVAVFDLATKKLVTKFDDKYYGSWTPDGRLVMTGAHKSGSVDGGEYKAVQPGIFITDRALANITRIDPELDDPSPYHASVSPDGKKIAFVMNNHVWTISTDGTGLKQLTDVDRDNIETYPVWSPDGKSVACWVYKTFERSYYTAIAVIPAASAKPVVLADKAAVWPRDVKGFRLSGGSGPVSWR